MRPSRGTERGRRGWWTPGTCRSYWKGSAAARRSGSARPRVWSARQGLGLGSGGGFGSLAGPLQSSGIGQVADSILAFLSLKP